MAYAINTGAIIEWRLYQRLYDQTVINVFHYYAVDAVNVTNGASALGGLTTNLNGALSLIPSLKQIQTSDCEYIKAEAQVIHPLRYRAVSTPLAGTGAQVSPSVAPNQSLSVELYAEVATRHGVGRKAFAGLPEASRVGGLWDIAGFAGALALVNTNILTQRTITSSGTLILTPCILNRAAPGQSQLIVGAISKEEVRVQRRRTVGLGI